MAKAKKRWCVWVRWEWESESYLVCTFENIPGAWSAHEMASRYTEITEWDGRFGLDTVLMILPEGRRPK